MAPNRAKPDIPELHTPHGRVLIAVHAAAEPPTYYDLAAELDLTARTIRRVTDDMIEAGWLDANKTELRTTFTIRPDGRTSDDRTISDWLDVNAG